jgi:hypothetical protein
MRSETLTLPLPVAPDRVFAYLSDIENLPGWATEFCRKLTAVDGKHVVLTPQGELAVAYRADAQTGVIDMFAGPPDAPAETLDRYGILPVRVVPLPGGTSVVLFTMFQAPDQSDEQFEGQVASLRRELGNIERRFVGQAA